MGKKKSGLEDSNAFQRRVVAWRVAEMLAGDALGRPRPDVIRVEVDEAGQWDDLQEQVAERIDRWQVKRQQEALPAEAPKGKVDLKRLVEALRDQPGVAGHFLFMSDVEIRSAPAASKSKRPSGPKIGTLRDLRAMSDRWRGQRVDVGAAVAALTADERPLFEVIVRWIGGPAGAVKVLSTLTVERARTLADLEHEGKDACARIFEDRDLAWTLITARVEEVRHGEQELRPADLWRRLVDCALQAGLRAPLHMRDAYLRNVLEQAKAEQPLSGLVGAALDMPLWELWVERAVTWEQPLPPAGDVGSRFQNHAASPETDRASPSQPEQHARNVEALRDDLRRVLSDPPSKLLVVHGEAGSGKSQLFRRTWADLADHALAEPAAPAPFHLRAQDLAQAPIDQAIVTARGIDAAKVHRHQDARIYLIDGLDEVSPNAQDLVKSRLRELMADPRTVVVAVSCRPSHRVAAPADALQLWIEPWSETDAEALMDRWERQDPEAARRFRQAPHAASLRSSPLILTLALWVARIDPDALRSRARVFSRVVEQLVLAWPQGRGAPSGDAADRWEELAPVLGELAWSMLSAGVSDLNRSEVEQHLRSVRPARLMIWLDWADRQLGLLVRTGEGRYGFLLRPLAEHLAGLHLATRDDAEILEASDQIWGAEVVRHALGHLSDVGDRIRVQRLVAALVEGWEQDFQTALGLRILVRPLHLRRVLVAARACADIGETVAPLAEQLGEVFWSYLSEETSVWVGDRMVAAVEEIAAAGGPVWEVLHRGVVEVLSSPSLRPSVPTTEDVAIMPADALWLTLHRDPQVRATMAAPLAPLARSAAYWPLLLALLADTDHTFWVEPLGLQLCRQLRAVDRELMPKDARDTLDHWLQHERSLSAQLAAIVLRPDEAPPMQLAAGLMRVATSYNSMLDLVQELGATPEGALALNDIWPDWRTRVTQWLADDTMRHRPRTVSLISQTVLRRLCRSLGAERHADSETLALFTRLAQGGHDDAARTLCWRAISDPAAIRPLLAGRRGDEPDQDLRRTCGTWGPLAFEAQALLRIALDRHPSLREELLELWTRLRGDRDLTSWFPGATLEGVVMAGDRASTEIYAQWILTTNQYRVPTELQAIPAVRAALCEDALRTWRWATVRDVKGYAGSPAVAGYGLAKLWTYWADTEIFDGVLQWLESPDLEVVHGALVALSAVPATDPRLNLVVEHFKRGLQRLLGEDGLSADLRRIQTILVLRSSALLEPLAETLGPLLDAERADVALAAGVVLVPFLDDTDVSPLVEALAAEWPQGAWLPQLEEAVTSLVLAHPAAFTLRILEIATDNPQEALRLAASIQHLLPADQRERVLARVRPAALTPFPWQPISGRQLKRARPLDLLDQLAFDLGRTLVDR